MDAIVTPFLPLGHAVSRMLARAADRYKAFLLSQPVPTWIEYMSDYNRK